MTGTIQERVAQGAAWLDEVQPGWRDQIDLDALDLGSMTDCVMGQVFAHDLEGKDNGYTRGCYLAHTLDVPWFGSDRMGFTSTELDWALAGGITYERKHRTAEWRRVIHASRVPAEVVSA